METKDFSSLSCSPNEAEPAIAPCPSADDGTSALSPEQQRLQRLRRLVNKFFEIGTVSLIREFQMAGLSLRFPAVSTLQTYYRDVLQRVPVSEELAFAAAFAAACEKSPASLLPQELLVQDAVIAESYADAMKKYAFLTPDYQTPCSMERLFALAGEAVRLEAAPLYSDDAVSVFSAATDDAALADCYAGGLTPLSVNAGQCIGMGEESPFPDAKQKVPMTVAILSPGAAGAEPLGVLLSNAALRKRIVSYSCAPIDQLLPFLIRSRIPGLSVDLSQCPRLHPSAPMSAEEYRFHLLRRTFLTSEVFGGNVLAVLIANKHLPFLRKLSRGHGFNVCTALRIQKEDLFTLKENGRPCQMLRLSLLRALTASGHRSIAIPSHTLPAPALSVEKQPAEWLFGHSASPKYACLYRVSVNPFSGAAPFYTALQAVTAAVTAALKDGFHAKNARLCLSIRAELPSDTPKNIGASMATVLGLYRAQTELSLSDEHSSLSMGAAGTEPVLTVSLWSAGRPDKATAIQAQALGFTDDPATGLPDFAQIRASLYPSIF